MLTLLDLSMYHTLSRVTNVKFKNNLFKELKIVFMHASLNMQLDSIHAKLFYQEIYITIKHA